MNLCGTNYLRLRLHSTLKPVMIGLWFAMAMLAFGQEYAGDPMHANPSVRLLKLSPYLGETMRLEAFVLVWQPWEGEETAHFAEADFEAWTEWADERNGMERAHALPTFEGYAKAFEPLYPEDGPGPVSLAVFSPRPGVLVIFTITDTDGSPTDPGGPPTGGGG